MLGAAPSIICFGFKAKRGVSLSMRALERAIGCTLVQVCVSRCVHERASEATIFPHGSDSTREYIRGMQSGLEATHGV